MSRPAAPFRPPAEDPATGRAFIRSLAILGVIVVGVLVVFFWDSWRSVPQHATPHLSSESPDALAEAVRAMPAVTFTDVTEASGIRFRHANGAAGEKLLPETMGSGVAVLDFNGDGLQDLLLVNGTDWPWTQAHTGRPPTHALYQNLGDGRFADVTAGSGLDVAFQGMGVAVGDYDNDGRVDVFISGVGDSRLFHNEGGGRFLDVTQAAGLQFGASEWGTSATFFDYDNDGKLDLFVCEYVKWSREIDLAVNYRLSGIGRAYGPPSNFAGSHSRLFHNAGGGHFTDASASAGIQVSNKATGLPLGKSLGVSPVDLDRDGWMDLVVANDTVQNFVFRNERNGQFREVGAASGIAFDSFGGTRGAMGIDAARVQEEDQLSIAIGNFANEMTALYVSQRDPMLFSDEAIGQGIGASSRLMLTFGVFFFDYDLDGWLDFLTANGHIDPDIHVAQKNQQYRQPAALYWNARGAGRAAGFVAVPPAKSGPDLLVPRAGRGAAFGDLDGDGDLDVVLTQAGGPPVLLRNDQKLGRHWIRFSLRGTRSNRDGIGAWVRVSLPDRVVWRQVMPTRGYLSQSELPVTIGLGTGTEIREVEVQWPGGAHQKVSGWKVDRLNTVVEAAPGPQ